MLLNERCDNFNPLPACVCLVEWNSISAKVLLVPDIAGLLHVPRDM